MRRHSEGSQLDQPEPASHMVGRVEFVDAELGAMRVPRDVDQQVTEHAIHEPGRVLRPIANLAHGDLEFVDGITPSFIHSRRLAGGPNEPARKQIR